MTEECRPAKWSEGDTCVFGETVTKPDSPAEIQATTWRMVSFEKLKLKPQGAMTTDPTHQAHKYFIKEDGTAPVGSESMCNPRY